MAAQKEAVMGMKTISAKEVVAEPGGRTSVRLEICDFKETRRLHASLVDNGKVIFHASADAIAQEQYEICIQEASRYKDLGRAWADFEMDLGRGHATFYLSAEAADVICSFLSANAVTFCDWRDLSR
jgi:hypothetical protein